MNNINNIKYVIWGAGWRGKRLLEVLGKEHVVAFIDRQEKKIGTQIE